jgi:hypothetical protein
MSANAIDPSAFLTGLLHGDNKRRDASVNWRTPLKDDDAGSIGHVGDAASVGVIVESLTNQTVCLKLRGVQMPHTLGTL